jgi:hypothetical protein
VERLGKLVKQLKEAVQTRDVAEVVEIEEYDLEYDAEEGAVTGHATINVAVTGGDGVRGNTDWPDIEGLHRGILRSLEYQIMGMLQDRVPTEQKVELPDGSEYTPDWEKHGEIGWSRQAPFRAKRGEPITVEVEVTYRDEVG